MYSLIAWKGVTMPLSATIDAWIGSRINCLIQYIGLIKAPARKTLVVAAAIFKSGPSS